MVASEFRRSSSGKHEHREVAVKKKEKREQSINRFLFFTRKVLAKNKEATTTRLRDEERQSLSRESPI
jgi:hypothetical protein